MKLDRPVDRIRMPGRSGLEVVERLRQAGWDIPVVVITDLDDLRMAVLNLIGRDARS